MRAWIESITFTSPKCYYCDNPWEHRVEIETRDSETKELTGNIVDIYVCQSCRDTRFTAFEDRIRSSTPKPSSVYADKQKSKEKNSQ